MSEVNLNSANSGSVGQDVLQNQTNNLPPEPPKIELPPPSAPESSDPLEAAEKFAARSGISIDWARQIVENKVITSPVEDSPNNISDFDRRQAFRADEDHLGETGKTANTPATNSTTNSAAAISGADAAISFAQSPPPNKHDDNGSWGLWCLGLVNQAYQSTGQTIPQLQKGSAYEAYQAFNEQGLIHNDGSNPPKGAIVFYDWQDPETGKRWGHTGISLGDGTFVGTTTSGNPPSQIRSIQNYGLKYLGWAYPDASKAGKPSVSNAVGNLGNVLGGISNAVGAVADAVKTPDTIINQKINSLSDKSLAAWLKQQPASATFKGASPPNQPNLPVYFKNFGTDKNRPDAQIYTYQQTNAAGKTEWRTFEVVGTFAHAYNEMELGKAGSSSDLGLPISGRETRPNLYDGKPFQKFQNGILVEVEPGKIQRFDNNSQSLGSWEDPEPISLNPKNREVGLDGSLQKLNSLSKTRRVSDDEYLTAWREAKGAISDYNKAREAREKADAGLQKQLGELNGALSADQREKYIKAYYGDDNYKNIYQKEADEAQKLISKLEYLDSLVPISPVVQNQVNGVLFSGYEQLANGPFADKAISWGLKQNFKEMSALKLDINNIFNTALPNLGSKALFNSGGDAKTAAFNFQKFFDDIDKTGDFSDDGQKLLDKFKTSNFFKSLELASDGKTAAVKFLNGADVGLGAFTAAAKGTVALFAVAATYNSLADADFAGSIKNFLTSGDAGLTSLEIIGKSLSKSGLFGASFQKGAEKLANFAGRFAPGIGIMADAFSLYSSTVDRFSDPTSFGKVVSALGDLATLTGGVLQFSGVGTLAGILFHLGGAALYFIGGAIQNAEQESEFNNQQKDILANIIGDPQATVLANSNPENIRKLSQELGLNPKDIQTLAGERYNEFFNGFTENRADPIGISELGQLAKAFNLNSTEIMNLINLYPINTANIQERDKQVTGLRLLLGHLSKLPNEIYFNRPNFNVNSEEDWIDYLESYGGIRNANNIQTKKVVDYLKSIPPKAIRGGGVNTPVTSPI